MKKIKNHLLLIAAIVAVTVSCSKDDDQKPTPTPDEIILHDNVKIVDKKTMELDSNPELINAGIYQFEFNGDTPVISIGDVIIGDQGEGFLRKVTAVNVTSNKITLQTTDGDMTDVFQDGTFNFSVNMDDMEQKKNAESFKHSFSARTLYKEGPLSIVLDNGEVELDPNWNFDFKFSPAGIEKFEMSAQNAVLNGQFKATVTASQATTLGQLSSSLLNAPYKKKFTKYVPATLLGLPILVPVTITVEIDLIAEYSAKVSAAVSRSGTFTSNNTFSLGIKYENNQWNGINSFNPDNTFRLNNSQGNANLNLDLALTPKISAKLYGIIGPYASISLKEQVTAAVKLPEINWDFKADIWLKSTVGIEAGIKILDKKMTTDYNHSWETPKLSYHTPYKIAPVSGNNQLGTGGEPLSNPIVVKVVDELEHPQSGVNVYFSIVHGGGSVNTQVVITDDQGIASAIWTLGNEIENELRVSTKKADGSNILNSPLTFFATSGENLLGTWKLESFENGILIGQFFNQPNPTCPNIITQAYTITSSIVTFTQNAFTENQTSIYKHFNLVISSNCTVTGDNPDTQNTYNDTSIGTYTLEGNTMTIMNEEEEEPILSTITFITPNKIKLDDRIYIRQ